MPTTTTTTVAATGTAIFKSTQSGIQGKSILTPGDSLIGAIVPRIQKNNDFTFMVISFAPQYTNHNNGNNYDQNCCHYGDY